VDTLKPTFTDALAPRARDLLEHLAGCRWTADAYLAGSAALGLYIGHRRVHDLDFMSSGSRLRPANRRDLLADLLEIDSATTVETARDGFLFARVGSVAARFFFYPYPLIDPLEESRGVPVASAIDLALMKLGAVISRGTKRDFLDLFLLCRKLPLADILERADEKFGHVRDFPLQALKGLADTSLAVDEPMPTLEIAVDWAHVEAWIQGEVRLLGRERVGLAGTGGAQ
jgi:hypothetical protein